MCLKYTMDKAEHIGIQTRWVIVQGLLKRDFKIRAESKLIRALSQFYDLALAFIIFIIKVWEIKYFSFYPLKWTRRAWISKV